LFAVEAPFVFAAPVLVAPEAGVVVFTVFAGVVVFTVFAGVVVFTVFAGVVVFTAFPGVVVFTAFAGVLLGVAWVLLVAVDGVGLAVEVPFLLADPGVGVGVGDGDAAFWPPELELLAPGFCAVAIIAIAVASART
jgi:hypothetical protein